MPLPRPAARDDLTSPTPDGAGFPADSAARSYECDGCNRRFEGAPDGSGLFVWTRGEETRYEEPPLCGECAQRITMGALLKWSLEEEEEG